jgi:mannose-6-phosphate isomerase
VDRSAWSPARLGTLRGGDRLLPAAADAFFRVRRLHGGDRVPRGFAVAVAVAGRGRLTGEHDDLPVARGDTLLVPYAAGPLRLSGDVEVIRLAPAA